MSYGILAAWHLTRSVELVAIRVGRDVGDADRYRRTESPQQFHLASTWNVMRRRSVRDVHTDSSGTQKPSTLGMMRSEKGGGKAQSYPICIQSTFALSYAFGQLISGGLLDGFGTRVGYAVALAAWSVSSILHAFARGPLSFGLMRGLLGVSESPAFPAAAKILAEWVPPPRARLRLRLRQRRHEHGGHSGACRRPLVVGARPNYLVPFMCASLAYLIALSVIHVLAPRLAPAIIDEGRAGARAAE